MFKKNKKLLLLALIPYLGWFIVALMIARKGYKESGILRGILYYFLAVVIWVILMVPYPFIHTYLIWPIGIAAIIVSLVLVVFYIIMVIASWLTITVVEIIDRKNGSNENID